MLKLLVGVIFLSGFLDISVVSVDKEDGQRVNDDGSESNIAFDSADLTAAVRAVNGEYQLEAYRSINNDRILLEISKEQNSANLLKISQLRWMSIGQPMFVKMPDVWNDSELFHESDDGFSTHIQMLTLDHRKELASVARRKYSLNITADQITNLVLSKFECRLIMFDQHEEKHLLTGIVTDFRHFPLRMDFDAPLRSTARKLFLKERRSIDLKFKCGLCTKGKLMRTNTLSITAQQIQDFGLEESLLGKASGNESKDVFVSRNQLSELANEMYSKLNILEEYEMPEHTFSDAFVHGLIGQITSSQFSQVPIDEALSSLSKYGFDVREDLRPDVIKSDLRSVLTVEDFGNKSRIVVNKDEYKKLDLSAAGKVLLKFGILIKGITLGVETELDLSGSMSSESKVVSLEEQLNELNSQSRNDMKWEFEGNKVVPKSLNVARLTRSKFSKTLTFNRVRTQSYIFPFSRQFTLYTHRALPEKPQTMYWASKAPMRHRLIQLEIELKTTNRQLERVTSELKATIEHLQNVSQPGKNDEQELQIPGTAQSQSTACSQSSSNIESASQELLLNIQNLCQKTSRDIQLVLNPPRDCTDIRKTGKTSSGIYLISVSGKQLEVYCDFDTPGGDWLVFQRRINGQENFYRTWTEYRDGFGDVDEEFWLGNEMIHKITKFNSYKLRIDLMDFDKRYASIQVGSQAYGYKLTIGNYTGNAGDGLNNSSDPDQVSQGMQFSTYDVDHDKWPDNCAVVFKGAWWYNSCHISNLNGAYLRGNHSSFADGIEWFYWTGYHYSLKFTEMKITARK